MENPSSKSKDNNADPDLTNLKCFVIMPYGEKGEYAQGNKESDYIFNHIIKIAVKNYEERIKRCIEIVREIDKNSSGNITKSIVKQIALADICIVDVTGLNANVFFELGIRYSLRRRLTILLRQEETKIPFDISGYKCISYDCFRPNIAITAISEFLENGNNEIGGVDSLVFETFPDMQIFIPGNLREVRESASNINSMEWNEWWTRVQQMGETLKESSTSGYFAPSAIIGISNGGLLVADIIGRTIYNGTPVVSLWADRTAKPTQAKISSPEDKEDVYYFFDNDTNKATLQRLKKQREEEDGVLNILLIDDIVATGKTVQQAISFIKKELIDKYELVFTPLFCNDKSTLEKFKDVLPIGEKHHKKFGGITDANYYKRLITPKNRLPYDKPLF